MGLYLCVFDDGDELDGVEVGSYEDFATLRTSVAESLEGGRPGSRFPVLMLHSDCDGEWSPSEAAALARELDAIQAEFGSLPSLPLTGWKEEIASTFGIAPRSLADCFFDVDGESLWDRLRGLCALSTTHRLPILFQ
jgi:hypothetical protein